MDGEVPVIAFEHDVFVKQCLFLKGAHGGALLVAEIMQDSP